MRRLVVAFLIIAALAYAQRAADARRYEAARALLDDGVTRLVILGDSVARGAGDERGLGIAGFLSDRAIVNNLGLDGARTHDVRRLVARSKPQVRTADVVVISIGGNDLYGDSVARLLAGIAPSWRQKMTIARVDGLVASVRTLNPAARIYILGLYNPYRNARIAQWLDVQVNLWDARLISRFARAPRVTVVRICDLFHRAERISPIDRFHPGSAGYAAIAARIAASM